MVDPQHENQLLFVSVITQATTVNSIPNTKLNSKPQNQTLKNTRHNFSRFSIGNEALIGNVAQWFGAKTDG